MNENNQYIYFDSASVIFPDKELSNQVFVEFLQKLGSSQVNHFFGRNSRDRIETSRKRIAEMLNINPVELIFTSSGTESIHTILLSSIKYKDVKNIYTHHNQNPAIVQFFSSVDNRKEIESVHFSNDFSLDELSEFLQKYSNTMVSVCHANPVTGKLLPINQISKLCSKYNAVFHLDISHTLNHYKIDLTNMNVDYASASACNFGGFQGVGLLFAKQENPVFELFLGENQEFGFRAGEENITGILSVEHALILNRTTEINKNKYLTDLKQYFVQKLNESGIDYEIIGGNTEKTLPSIIAIWFRKSNFNPEILALKLDIEGIAVRHFTNPYCIRFSFNQSNTTIEIDYCIKKLQQILL